MPKAKPRVDQSTKLAALVQRRKVAMLEAGVSGLDIATALNVSKQAVSNVIRGRKKTQRIAEAIARACRRPVEELFPDDDDDPARANAA